MTTRIVGFVVFAVFAISLSLSTVASAQTFDHLKCYKMKDPHNFTALANLTPIQNPPFPVEPGCKIKVRGLEFCIPVDKALVPGGNAPSAQVVGQPLTNDYICYNMRCPKPASAIPPVLVSDQFGSRTLQKFVARRICTPAIKGVPTTTTTSTTITTTTTTTTTLPTSPCSLDAGGTCSGTCPNVNDVCLPNATGVPCTCQQQGPVACNLATFPMCNGTCPAGLICEKDITTSFCYCCGVLAAPCTTNADCCGGFSCIAGTCQ
jgi:hypothetical protein